MGDFKQKPLLSLDSPALWGDHQDADQGVLASSQLHELLNFIEQEYGAAGVAHLLGAVNSAKSLKEAIENGLGVPFDEFDQKWQAWAKQNLLSQ